MKIGEVARASGTPVKTIRYYEGEGLLPPPPRTSSRYRIFGLEDLARLQFIRKAKRLGLSLTEIKGILRLYERNEPTCSHVRMLLDQKLSQVTAALNDLQQFRDELLQLRERAGTLRDCRPTGARICGIIEETALVALNENTQAVTWLRPSSKAGNVNLQKTGDAR